MTAACALEAVLCGRLPQAFLLTGEQGSGKMTLALGIAAALLCMNRPAGRPACGVCNACHKMSRQVHTDLTVIDEQEREIKVDMVRQLRRTVSILPNDGDRRVVIVRHAHRLNILAQNALLKTLEEPPAFAFFILTTDKPDALLATMLSRLSRYELAPAAADAPNEAFLAPLAPILAALAARDEAATLRASMLLEKLTRPQQREVLGLLQTAMRDAAFAANALPERLLPALSAQTSALARTVAPRRLLALASFFSLLADRLDVNASAAATSSALCAGAYSILFV